MAPRLKVELPRKPSPIPSYVCAQWAESSLKRDFVAGNRVHLRPGAATCAIGVDLESGLCACSKHHRPLSDLVSVGFRRHHAASKLHTEPTLQAGSRPSSDRGTGARASPANVKNARCALPYRRRSRIAAVRTGPRNRSGIGDDSCRRIFRTEDRRRCHVSPAR
jgi:hypothetical protein